MKTKLLSNLAGRREWALVMDSGDEAMAELKRFAATEHLTAAHLTGIGAFSRVTVAWYDLAARTYRPIEIGEQVEVISLIGDVAEADGKPSVHVHLCVAKSDGTAHGGHLQRGEVRPTLEVILVESPAHLRKTFRPETGLALIDLDR
ncbi:MAG TPA: PPC domain-containing DNA-binding protein [Candidatus Didemnitutus sp.]|nr:PPC domain-containing DNA-binding protein [Candidatus Didemnitutus sp.]